MKVLRLLGWLLFPYILIFFRWKHIKIFPRILFIFWSLVLLNAMFHSNNQQSIPTNSVASAQAQQTNKPAKVLSSSKPVTTPSKPLSKQSSQDPTLEQQKSKLDAEIQEIKSSKNTSYQEKMKVVKDYINIDKSGLLVNYPNVRDMGFAGDLFIQINKHTVKQLSSVGDQFISQKANGVYWEVQVSLGNAGPNPIQANTYMFTLITSDGRKFSTDTKSESVISKPIIVDTLNPGVDDTGYLIFDMPKDLNISDVMLNVQNGLHSVKLKIN